LVRQSDAWTEIIPILGYKLPWGVPVDGNLGKEARRQRVRPSVGNVEGAGRDVVACFGIPPLGGHGNEFVPQADIQGEPFAQFNVVLRVEEIAGLLKRVVDE